MKYDNSNSIISLLNEGAMVRLEGRYWHRLGRLIYSNSSIYSESMFLHDYKYSCIEKVIPRQMVKWGLLRELHEFQKLDTDWYAICNGIYPKYVIYNIGDVIDIIMKSHGLTHILTGPAVNHGILNIFRSHWKEINLYLALGSMLDVSNCYILDKVNINDGMGMYDNPTSGIDIYEKNGLLRTLELASLAIIITDHSIRITKNRDGEGNIIVYFDSII